VETGDFGVYGVYGTSYVCILKFLLDSPSKLTTFWA